MKYIKVLIGIILCTLSLSVLANTNYQAQAQAADSIQKSLSAVKIAEQATEQERLKAIQALASKLDGSQALSLALAETFASIIKSGSVGQSSGNSQQVVQVPAIPQETPECNFLCYVGKGTAGLFGLVERTAPVVLAGYQSRNQLIASIASTNANRDIQVNAQNTNAEMFANAGRTNASIAGAGFNAVGSVARDGFNTVGGVAGAFAARPTVNITNSGDYAGFALFDSTTKITGPVTTNVNCPTTASTTSNGGTSTAGQGQGDNAPGQGGEARTGNPVVSPPTSGNCTTTR